MDIEKLKEQRQIIFNNTVDNKNPERVLTTALIMYEAALQYTGLNIRENQISLDKLDETLRKIHNDFPSDTLLCTGPSRDIIQHNILKSKAFIMAETGIIQHPESHSLEAEEYDRFIENPYETIIEVCLPRLYEALNDEPAKAGLAFAESYRALQVKNETCGKVTGAIAKEKGYISMGGGFTEAPLDFLSDLIRSFSGICKDMRRCPEKVAEACQSVLPIVQHALVRDPNNVKPYNYVNIPLHMAPYMNRKQFETLYWPSFKSLIDYGAKYGQLIHLFVEQNWMRYIDDLVDLDGRIIMRFEEGDYELIANKNNNKHVISGLYPVMLLKTATKDACIDEAKKILDIVASGNRYILHFDKTIFELDDTVSSNFREVMTYFLENGKY